MQSSANHFLNRDGHNYVFAASCSKYKENPPDWSQSVDEFEKALRFHIHYYNHDRIKLRLKGKSPVEYSHCW